MTMDERVLATQIIESLRKGIPPQRGVHLYSVGNEKLLDGIKRYHLSSIGDQGIIRFISGSWGAGKTHFFRLLREVAFQNSCLVSNVELDVNNAALNKFERVFFSIISNIMTPAYYEGSAIFEAAPFGTVICESLAYLGTGSRTLSGPITFEQYNKAIESLMSDHRIDIDFKKMVQEYWKTYLPEAPDPAIIEQTRGELLQWFRGEGTLGGFRKRFGVSKLVSKDSAKIMLQSLAGFVRLAGYTGLVILFDEAEQAYSVMRKSALKDAHNNLLSLINNIEKLPGLFLLYATTPDFFTDPKHGIVIYGALSGRIGEPKEHHPRSLDTIWNLDSIETSLPDYQNAAKRIRSVYAKSYPQAADKLPSDADLDPWVAKLFSMHPSLAAVRFWRLLVSALITHFDDLLEGEVRPAQKLYDDVMDRLRED